LIGIVIVSHSETLANGVVALAREMASDELRIEAAGGLNDSDPTHPTLGTDAERVRVAIEAASAGGDGVLVLMDLGSALMSAEFAAEMVDGVEVVLSDAPLVEGAVAAAAAASGGASLAEVAAEARGALAMKRTQLGGDPDEAADAADPGAADPDAEDSVEVTNAVGLHARPAARVVALARGFDADVSLATGDRWVSAASLTGVVSLGTRQGDTVRVRASGPDAQAAVDAFVALARDGFGDTDEPAATPPSQPAAPAARAAPATDGVLAGVPVSPGVVVGSVHRLDAVPELAPPAEAPAGDPGEERAALEDALAHTRAALAADRDRVAGRVAGDAAEVFDAHLALLDDAALLDPARAAIDGGATAARAWYDAVQQVADVYRGLDEPLLRERAADVLDVGGRVLAALTGSPAPARTGEGVVIAAELTPADAAALDPEHVTGIATAHGSATAHAAILARALGLPAVVGLGDKLLAIADGTEVLLDGGAGTLALAPDAAAAQDAREQALALTRRRTAAREHAVEPAVTRDGTPIEVFANLGGAGPTVAGAVALGAEGVGLLRTEFLYLDRPQLPSEDEQVKTLHEIARVLDGRPLVVRTLDAGADKPLPALPTGHEDNPFLGVRGVRLSLARPEVFATQLRAVLRVAAAFPGAIRLMAPMVSVADEVIAVRRMLDDARRELGIDAPLPFGIMVEVPAAALSADELAAHVDFFSIGTNDLTQYTMAAERGNERLAPLLTGLRLPVLELVRRTVQAAGTRPVAVCGELAGDPDAAAALVRAGVRELSMSPALIPEAKAALRELTLTDGG
jgi:phosphoenolpyruvate-protein phosphotransferase/dihydroxyacetone kinase phosphotransfer subunit